MNVNCDNGKEAESQILKIKKYPKALHLYHRMVLQAAALQIPDWNLRQETAFQSLIKVSSNMMQRRMKLAEGLLVLYIKPRGQLLWWQLNR